MRDEIRWRKLFRLVQAMALRNIVRQKHRTAFTLGAIAFGVASLILTGGFIQDIYRQLANAIIYSQSGHLQVARAGYFETGIRNPSAFLAEEQSLRAVIGSVQSDVVQSMARMSSAGVISTGRRERPVLVEGIEPSKEAALGVSFKHLEGEALKDDEKFSVAIGAGLAQALKLKAGDTATLLVTTPYGAFNTVDLKVAGVFQSFFKEYDNRVVRMPLATLQDVLAARGANTLVVQLKDGADARVVAETLREETGKGGYEIRAWYELNDFYDKTVQLYDRQFGAVRVIIFLMVMLSVVNAVNMSVLERLGEVGTMRALGDSSRDVFVLIVAEVVILGLIGALLGVGLGVAGAKLISAVGIPMPPPPNSDMGYTARIQIEAATCVSAFLTGLVAAIVASLRSARIAARMPICAALRQAI